MILIGESFSPWTKKARWALEQCQVDYEYREYIPTLSEPGLRFRMRQWSGAVSVPVLFAGSEIRRGSWEIAIYANEAAGGGRLGDLEAVAQWNSLSEDALAEGRTRVVRSIMGNPRALQESLPTFVPEFLRSSLRFVARDAARRLDRKYAHLSRSGALRNALLRTREGLTQAGGDYLLGQFSYADIAMAVVLEVVTPIAKTVPPLGAETLSCWIDSNLADEFQDLVEWRNRLAASNETSYSQFR